jgi:hypothetical protein
MQDTRLFAVLLLTGVIGLILLLGHWPSTTPSGTPGQVESRLNATGQ